jgi:TPR repeat protein
LLGIGGFSPLAAQERLPVNVSDAVRDAVVKVKAQSDEIPRRSASGFRWAQPDLVVTAYHVVAGADSITVLSPGPEGLEATLAELVSVDVEGDLALLKLNRQLPGNPLSVASTPPAPGTSLWVVGYPFNISGYLSRALRLSDIAPDTLGEALDTTATAELTALGFPALDLPVLHVEGGLLPGDSGAPIIDSEGRVIGIANGGLKQGKVALGWGIPANRLDGLTERGLTRRPVDPEVLQRIRASFFSQVSRERMDEAFWATAEQLDTLAGYRDYLDHFPNGAFASAARTRLNDLERRHAQAIDYFNRGIDYQERVGMGGDLDTVREMHARAEYNLKRAIDIYPRFEAAHLALGRSKYLMAGLLTSEQEKQDAYKAAIDDLNNAIDLNPGMAEAYIYRGFAYSNISEYRHACDDYIRFIRLKDSLSPERYEHYRQGRRFTRGFLEYHGCDIPRDIEFDAPKTATDPTDPKNVRRDCRPDWWEGEAEYCAERGNRAAMARLAGQVSEHYGNVAYLTAAQTKEVEAGVKYASKLAELGDARGFYYLGLMYWNANGKPYVPELAFAYMKRAVEGEYPDAFDNLGMMYMRGLVGAPNHEAARQTWARGAVLGDSHSASALDEFDESSSLQRQRARMFNDFKALLLRGSCTNYEFQERGEAARRYEAGCRQHGADALTPHVIKGLVDVQGREEEAVELLAEIYPSLPPFEKEQIVYALRDLRKLTPKAVDLLYDIVLANQPEEDPDRINRDDTARKRSDALEALMAGGPRARPVADKVSQLLTSPDRHTRLMALGVIGEIGDPDLVNRIRPLLSDPSNMVRLEAERYISKLADNDS